MPLRPPWRHQGHGVELLFFARLGGEKKTVVELTLLGYLDIKHVINYNIYLDMLDIRHIGYVGY